MKYLQVCPRLLDLSPEFSDLVSALVWDFINRVPPTGDNNNNNEGSYTLAKLCERARKLQKSFQGECPSSLFWVNGLMWDA